MNRTVLVIAHSTGFRQSLAGILEGTGCLVMEAGNIKQAIVLLKAFKCDLVTWDLHNPEGGEDTLASQLLGCIDPEVPVVFVAATYSDLERFAAVARDRKRVQFLTKSVPPSSLSKTIGAMLFPEMR